MQALVVEYLPWALSVTTIVQSFLLGNKSIKGWVVGLGSQVGWTVWVIASATWGLVPLNIALWGLYIRNYFKWKRGDTVEIQLDSAIKTIAKLNADLAEAKAIERRMRQEIVSLRQPRRISSQEGIFTRPANAAPAPVPIAAPSAAPEPGLYWPINDDAQFRKATMPAFQSGGGGDFGGGGSSGSWESSSSSDSGSSSDSSGSSSSGGSSD